MYLHCSSHCAQRIIIVSNGSAEDSHDVVANVLVDSAAMGRDDRIDHLEVAIEERMNCLGAKRAREAGEAYKVSKQDSNLPALAIRGT